MKKRGENMRGKNIARRGASLVLSLCLLSGCASRTHWTKPGFNPDEFKQDCYLCDREANILASQQAGAMSSAVNPLAVYAITKRRFFNNCLAGKGYQRVKTNEEKKVIESSEESLSPSIGDQGDSWKYIGSTGKGGGSYWFIDTKTISYFVKGDVGRVWVRAILDEEGRLLFQDTMRSPMDLRYLHTLLDINCSKCAYKVLKLTFHKTNGVLIDSSDFPLDEPWRPIDPASMFIAVYKEICPERKELQIESSAPVTPASGTTNVVIVTWTSATIRSGLGNDHPVVKIVNQGDKLTVIGESGDWFNVKLEDGQQGWISNRVVKPTNTGIKPNAYGPGVNADAYGRATTYRLQNGQPLPPIFYDNVRRNAYGPGVHMDQFGRPVRDSRWP
jgi:hypothetical protein